MTQTQAQSAPQSSRLVSFLQDLAASKVALTHKNFTDKLGQLIDLTDSIALSESLRGLSRIQFVSGSAPQLGLQEEFLQSRRGMIEFIARSFTPGAVALPFSLPKLDEAALQDESTGYQPYLKFYALHQSDMEFRVQRLRLKIRQQVAGHSRELAQLVALDEALADALSAQSRKLFAQIPRLLGSRFDYLRQQQFETNAASKQNPQLWLEADGWLQKFYREMQGLLLAELDVRLQTVVGLVEAYEDATKNSTQC